MRARQRAGDVAHGGGCGRVVCSPPASSLSAPARFSCRCFPREPSQIPDPRSPVRELNATVSFLCRPPGPHLSLSEVPFAFSCASPVFVPCFLTSARSSERSSGQGPSLARRRGPSDPAQDMAWSQMLRCCFPGGWGGGEQTSKQVSRWAGGWVGRSLNEVTGGRVDGGMGG